MSRHTFGLSPRKDPALIYRNPIFKAMHRAPMAEHKRTDLALSARRAFESVQRGTCNVCDRDTLACMVNVCMVLAEWHCSAEDLADIVSSQEAMLRADGRALGGRRWNFDGEGRTAMLRALEIHEQLIELIGQTAVADAMLEVMARRDRGLVHRVVSTQGVA